MFRNQISTEVADRRHRPGGLGRPHGPDRYDEWNPGFAEITGRVEVGERLDVTFAKGDGRGMTMHPTVTVAAPERGFRWLGRLVLPFVFDGEHRFEIHEAGPGRVRFVQGERFRGVLVPFLRRLIERDTVAMFERSNPRSPLAWRPCGPPRERAVSPARRDRRGRPLDPRDRRTRGPDDAGPRLPTGHAGAVPVQARRGQGRARGAPDRRRPAGDGDGAPHDRWTGSARDGRHDGRPSPRWRRATGRGHSPTRTRTGSPPRGHCRGTACPRGWRPGPRRPWSRWPATSTGHVRSGRSRTA